MYESKQRAIIEVDELMLKADTDMSGCIDYSGNYTLSMRSNKVCRVSDGRRK